MCAESLTWGMPYDRFWHCSWGEWFAYMQKFQKENKNKYKELDFIAWNQGRYTRDALLDVYQMFNAFAGKKSKKIPYPKMPYSEKSEKEEIAKARQLEEKQTLEKTKELIQQHNLMIFAKKSASGASSD